MSAISNWNGRIKKASDTILDTDLMDCTGNHGFFKGFSVRIRAISVIHVLKKKSLSDLIAKSLMPEEIHV
jgi:hypothetical protein